MPGHPRAPEDRRMTSYSEGPVRAEPPGGGWRVFAGSMIVLAGLSNVIWGVAAIDKANFFVADRHFIFGDLSTWGWITLILGAIQVVAAFSIWANRSFGAIVGLVGASLSALAALLSIPAYPLWSLAIFAIDILIIHGLAKYGGVREQHYRV
jgi:hypothetical protein